jgi:hypothetical protein
VNTDPPEAGMTPQEIRLKYALRNYGTITKLSFLADAHLHPQLRKVSGPIRRLAFHLVERTQDGPELTLALDELISFRDRMVRHELAVHNFTLYQQPPVAKNAETSISK